MFKFKVWQKQIWIWILLLQIISCFMELGKANSGEITLWLTLPNTNNDSRACPGDSANNGTPLTDMKYLKWYGYTFTDTTKQSFGAIDVQGMEGDSIGTQFEIQDGAMGILYPQVEDVYGNKSCTNPPSYLFAFPYIEPIRVPGLTATYFDNPDFTGDQVATVDSLIDWVCGNWPMSIHPIPHGTIGPAHFAVRWEGYINIPTSGDWTFYALADDGVRVWVDDSIIIDRWINQSAEVETSGTVILTAGWKPLKVEYFRDTGIPCGIHLKWSGVGVPKQIVAPNSLTH